MSSGLSMSFRRHVPNWTLTVGGLLIAAALVASTPLAASAANPTPFNTNLVKNGTAENGINNWDTFPSGDFRTHKYGASGLGFPSKHASNKIGGGKHFFYAGPYDTNYDGCGDAHQQISLTGVGSDIDSGHVQVQLRGYAGTNGAASLNAHLDLYFRNGQNHQVANNGIARTVSSTNEKYRHIIAAKLLPDHTRILDVHLWADGDATVSSGDCQAFWDNISVVLKHV